MPRPRRGGVGIVVEIIRAIGHLADEALVKSEEGDN